MKTEDKIVVKTSDGNTFMRGFEIGMTDKANQMDFRGDRMAKLYKHEDNFYNGYRAGWRKQIENDA